MSQQYRAKADGVAIVPRGVITSVASASMRSRLADFGRWLAFEAAIARERCEAGAQQDRESDEDAEHVGLDHLLGEILPLQLGDAILSLRPDLGEHADGELAGFLTGLRAFALIEIGAAYGPDELEDATVLVLDDLASYLSSNQLVDPYGYATWDD